MASPYPPSGPVDIVQGCAVVLPVDDLDTDRIIPARYLKAITFEGLGAYAFVDDRAATTATGAVHPFDDPEAAGASILVTGTNFGCGSSREHAPRALAQWGIRAIVAPSFSEIFFGNAVAIGLPCVTLCGDDLLELRRRVAEAPRQEVRVDLGTRTVSTGPWSAALEMPESGRVALVTGHWDQLAWLLADPDAVLRVTARLPYLGGFASARS